MCLNDAGKRFNRDWIFRHVDLELHAGQRYAITGHNGSGKSTLLQLIGGMITPSEGRRTLELNGQPLDEDSSYREVSLCAPYLELIEEMTGMESLTFHQGFKPLRNGHTPASILEAVGLQKAAEKQIQILQQWHETTPETRAGILFRQCPAPARRALYQSR